MDIIVNTLNALDEVAIRTTHSEYRFQITDPTHCRGVLRGGLFGEKPHEAVLTGAVTPHRQRAIHPLTLEIGYCALFYVAVNESLKLLTTSPITDINLAQTALPARAACDVF